MILKHPKAPFAFGVLMIIGLVAYVTFYRSSPGDLSRPHAAVAGSPFIRDCNKCHAQKDVTPGCLACHTEIQAQFDQKKGFHPFLLKSKKLECARCHSEHNGSDFALVSSVSWEGKDKKAFNHPHVKFDLKGAHVSLACEKCHQAKTRPPFSLPKFPKMKRPGTYLGLSQGCISCHADPHAGGKAENCTGCHDQNHWKPAPLFNHDRFFLLRGAHVKVSCNKCHVPSTLTRRSPTTKWNVAFGPTRGKRCLDCHDNPHRTKWLEKCEDCHKGTDRTWAEADRRMTQAQHALTGFRLVTPHHKAKCLDCHGPDLPGIPFNERYPDPRKPGYVRFEKNCEACHKDEHRGQFTKNHPHCMDCHSRTAFKPPVYGVKEHKTYPLIGGHAKAACNACHFKERPTKSRRFIPTPKECTVCHKDIHYGQLRKENGKTRCEDCHQSTVKWSFLAFNHNTQSRFKLDDAHKKVACKECHFMVTIAGGIRLIQYKPIGMKCQDCHDVETR